MDTVKAIDFAQIVKSAEAKFHLKGKGKTYTLRKLNLLDEQWIHEVFKTDDTHEAVSSADISQLFKLAYHQLVEKEEFKGIREMRLGDDGFEKEVTITGPEMLMAAVADKDECGEVVEAIFTVIGLSRPIREKLQKIVEESQKATAKKKVKKSAGGRSSI